MKKVDFFIPNFDALGAQMVAINVANYLSKYFLINFVVFNDSGEFKKLLDKDIRIIKLDNSVLNFSKFKTLNRIIQYFKYAKKNKTDIVISFAPITNIVSLFAKFFNHSLKVVIQEHCFPSLAVKDRQNLSVVWAALFKNLIFKFYNYSDLFVTISGAIKEDFVNNFGVKSDLIKIVRNPVDINKITTLAELDIKRDKFVFENEKKYMIGVGRLVDQKNFSKLLDIFDIVKKNNPNTDLIILGQGPNLNDLVKKTEELDLVSSVHFLGFQDNPYQFLKRADCFCLTSVWEGLPQVIAEAMICKIPVVSVDCESGPREMIENNTTGILVDKKDDILFAKSVCDILNGRVINRDLIVERAYNFAVKEYSIENCLLKYLNIINSISI